MIIAGLLVGLFGPATVSAAPTTGYAAGTMFTKDPGDAKTKATSFDATDAQVCAWFFGQATEGSPAQGFEIEIEFYTPGGVKYESQWVDDGKVTFSSEVTNDAIARKMVKIAGTDAASEPGEWSVKFYVNTKLFKIESFTLTGGKKTTTTTTTTVTDVKAYLEEQGYKVYVAQDGKDNDGTPYAMVVMDMAANDLYSAEVSNQIYHAFYALRSVYPDAKLLACGLVFGGQYEMLFFGNATDWDTFYGGGKWEDFVKTLKYGVYDLQTQQPLSSTEAKNFMTKNFGTGGKWNPPNVKVGQGNPNTGMVSSVQVEVTPSTLPADGKSAAQVKATVYGKDNKPLSDIEVEFTLSGAAATGCRIRPTITATDSKGEATATFTAGTTNGSVNITAKAKSASGLAVVTVGSGGTSTDPAADEIAAFLTKYGYKVHQVGYITDQQGNKTSNVAVIMDMASNAFDDTLGQQLVLGWMALYQGYPDATGLYVILYYDRYGLFFGTTPTDLEAAIKASQASDQQGLTAFWNKVFGSLIVIDRTTGQRVTDVQGFVQKNFTKSGDLGGGLDLTPSAGPWSAAPQSWLEEYARVPLTGF
jgi:hypothetical protein